MLFSLDPNAVSKNSASYSEPMVEGSTGSAKSAETVAVQEPRPCRELYKFRETNNISNRWTGWHTLDRR